MSEDPQRGAPSQLALQIQREIVPFLPFREGWALCDRPCPGAPALMLVPVLMGKSSRNTDDAVVATQAATEVTDHFFRIYSGRSRAASVHDRNPAERAREDRSQHLLGVCVR